MSSRKPSLTRTSLIFCTLFSVFDMLPVPPTSTRYKAPVSSLKKIIGTRMVPLGAMESSVLHLCDFGRVEHLAVLLKDVAGLDVLALESNQQPVKFKPAELARPASQHPKISGFQDLQSCYSCSGGRFKRLFEDPLTGTM